MRPLSPVPNVRYIRYHQYNAVAVVVVRHSIVGSKQYLSVVPEEKIHKDTRSNGTYIEIQLEIDIPTINYTVTAKSR